LFCEKHGTFKLHWSVVPGGTYSTHDHLTVDTGCPLAFDYITGPI